MTEAGSHKGVCLHWGTCSLFLVSLFSHGKELQAPALTLESAWGAVHHTGQMLRFISRQDSTCCFPAPWGYKHTYIRQCEVLRLLYFALSVDSRWINCNILLCGSSEDSWQTNVSKLTGCCNKWTVHNVGAISFLFHIPIATYVIICLMTHVAQYAMSGRC